MPGWLERMSLTKSICLSVLISCTLQIIPLCLLADIAARTSPEAPSAILWLTILSIAMCLICPAVLCVLLSTLVFGRIGRLNRYLTRKTDVISERGDEQAQNEVMALEDLTYNLSHALDEAIERETAIADYSPNLLVSLDRNGCILAVSPAVAKLWHYRPEQLLGVSIKDITFQDDVDKTQRAIDTACAGDGKAELENRILCGNTQKLDMLWSLEWSATHRSLFCTATDITARKEIERLKEEFLAMISHDLRTPLAAVLASIQMLEALLTAGEENLSDRSRNLLSISQTNIQRLLGLVNEILDAEKLSAGKLVMDFAMCDIAEVVKTSIESVQGFAEQEEITLDWHADKVLLRADSGRLVQAVVNLLSNAVKFSPKGSTVKVTAHHDDKYVVIKITDQGPGIPAKHKTHIFERFQQLGVASGLPGTGLGLVICRDIVKAHNGEVGFESQAGKGSTFWIQLPTAATVSI